MKVSVTIGVTVRSRYYETGTNGYVELFLPRSIQFKAPDRVPITTDATTNYLVDFPLDLSMNTPLILYWYVERGMDGSRGNGKPVDGKDIKSISSSGSASVIQLYECRAGYGFSTLHDIIKKREPIPLIDVTGQGVGSVVIDILSVPPKTVYLNDAPYGSPFPYSDTAEREMDTYRSTMTNLIRMTTKCTESNISGYLFPTSFADTVVAVGTVPLWLYPYFAVNGTHMELDNCEDLLLRHLQIACYDMGIDDIESAIIGKDLTDRDIAEIIGEMQTVVPRYLLYVQDSVKRERRDITADEWAYPRDDPDTGDDCEGFSAVDLECCFLLRRGGAFKSKVLQYLQSFDRGYVPLFCIVTISLDAKGEKRSYHAMTIKLDRDWLAWKTGLWATPPSHPLLPAVILESTTYATSCWTYESPLATDSELKSRFFRSYSKTPIESAPKAPHSMLLNVYHHVQVGIPVDWVKEKGITRLEFSQMGKTGASFLNLMDYADSVSISAIRESQLEIERCLSLYECMPPLRPIRSPPLSATPAIALRKSPEMRTRQPKVSMVYRAIDWNDKVEAQVKRQTGCTTLEVAELFITDRLRGVAIRGW